MRNLEKSWDQQLSWPWSNRSQVTTGNGTMSKYSDGLVRDKGPEFAGERQIIWGGKLYCQNRQKGFD